MSAAPREIGFSGSHQQGLRSNDRAETRINRFDAKNENARLLISQIGSAALSGQFGLAVPRAVRDIEDLLAERGIILSYETVRRWVNHFGPKIAADLHKRRPKHHTTWHLDEVYLKIDGHMVYLWRAVDAEGEALDACPEQEEQAGGAETHAQVAEKIWFRPRKAHHG